MSLTDLPVDTAGNDIASARTRAIDAFLAQARGLLARSQDRAALQSVADALIALGQRKSLFPAAHFPIDAARPAQVYRLAEDVDGGFALYLSAGLAGKAQPPHDHTTWAVIAGVEGNERNVLYRREKTGDAARDALVQTGTVDVAAGSAVVLLPDDVHTIELVGGQDGRHLHFYGRALQLLDRRVVFEGTEGGSFRHFAPPKNIRHPAITPQALRAALADGEEIALLEDRKSVV